MCKFSRKTTRFLAWFALNFKIYTHQVWFCTETVKILCTKLISSKKSTKITEIYAFALFLFLVRIVAIYAILVCKIFGPKIRSCKFFLTNLKSAFTFNNFPENFKIADKELCEGQLDARQWSIQQFNNKRWRTPNCVWIWKSWNQHID